MKKRSYTGLKSDLSCANSEAQRYLNEVIDLRKQVFDLQIYKTEYAFLRTIVEKLLLLK